MKTQQQIEEMKNEIQKKIERAQNMARNAHELSDSNYWLDLKVQYMAQYNILLEVLK